MGWVVVFGDLAGAWPCCCVQVVQSMQLMYDGAAAVALAMRLAMVSVVVVAVVAATTAMLIVSSVRSTAASVGYTLSQRAVRMSADDIVNADADRRGAERGLTRLKPGQPVADDLWPTCPTH